jgi:hypothetical protein
MAGNDGNTVLLIHSDSTDGNTTFVDSSVGGANSPHTVNTVGNTHHEVDQFKFGATSIYFDGASDQLTIATDPDFNMGAGDFTLDFWLFSGTAADERDIVFKSGTGTNEFTITVGASTATVWAPSGAMTYLGVHIFWNGSSWALQFASTIPVVDSSWHHIALVRQGTSYKLYIDGTLDNSGTTTRTHTQQDIEIGGQSGDRWFVGYLDEIRLSNIARWTINFTPPTEAYTEAADQQVIAVPLSVAGLFSAQPSQGLVAAPFSLQGISIADSYYGDFISSQPLIGLLSAAATSQKQLSAIFTGVFLLSAEDTSTPTYVTAAPFSLTASISVSSIKATLVSTLALLTSLELAGTLKLVQSLNLDIASTLLLLNSIQAVLSEFLALKMDINELAKLNNTLGLINHILSASSGQTYGEYAWNKTHGIDLS